MKIKTKLTLGVGLLFALIILLSLVGAWHVNQMKSDTENILVTNYNTLLYIGNMLSALDDHSDKTKQKFEINLKRQEDNITEVGENEATADLRTIFEVYKLKNADTTNAVLIRQKLFQIMNMNMQAIQRKSEIAKATADTGVFWIAISGSMCFLIAFTMLVNLPSNIANPIKELTKSIKQISLEKYEERVSLEGHNEFAELAHSFNTMAEKLEEYNNTNLAKLLIEKARIETLINNMKDPVIGLDENLKIIFANHQAIDILGRKIEEIVGKDSKELALHNDLIRSLVQDLVATEPINGSTRSQPIKIFSHGKEGYFDKETVHISIQPTGEVEKMLIGHVIILNNVTEYRELDFAKTNFISTVSHEFKTPISSIKMSLQLLENEQIGKLNIEQKNLLDSINDDATRLLKFTSELLNMTQVESGNIQLSMLPSDPKEILLYATNATQTQAEQKQIKFHIYCPEHISKVQADTEKTAWVLTNLISNAINYSYDNSIIYLKIEEENKKVQISVRDTGQGIAPQYKDKIFDRYFRVPGTKREGTGLGLAISKEFIEAQNGQIKIESEFGAGSTFTITLNALI